MPFFDDYDDSFNATAIKSFNTTTENTLDADVDLTDVGNTDNSVNDSGNLAVGIEDSFKVDSHDLDVDTDVDVDDSFNVLNDSSSKDLSDHSVNHSYNTFTDESVEDSNNSWSFTSTDDHSVQVGNRDYNTGFGDLTVGGAAAVAKHGGAGGGGGDLFIDNRATIVDQSVNQNIDAGFVFQGSSSQAVVASGDDAVAAGDDVHIDTELDASTNITAVHGDVNLGNTTSISNTFGSYNSWVDDSSYTDDSVDVHIGHSFNDFSDTYSAVDSFNLDSTSTSTTDVDVDVNAIVHSFGAAIVDDISF